MTPSSVGTRGRVRSHAAAAAMRSPSTARLTTTVRMPVSSRAATSVTTTWIPVADSALAGNANCASLDGSSKEKATSPVSCSSSQVSGAVSSWVTTATTAESPSMMPGCERMLEMAPSRISPTPSGRSGITPGLGGGGAVHCGCEPAHVVGGRYAGGCCGDQPGGTGSLGGVQPSVTAASCHDVDMRELMQSGRSTARVGA